MSSSTISVGPLIVLVIAATFVGISFLVIAIRRKRAAAPVICGLILFAALGVGMIVNINSSRSAAHHAAYLTALAEQQKAAALLQREAQFDPPSHPVMDEAASQLANAVAAHFSKRQVIRSSSDGETFVLNEDASQSASGSSSQFAPTIPTTLPPVVAVSESFADSSCESETFPCVFSHSLGGYILRGGAMSVLLILAYLFLDAGRRGRYTWPVRFGTAVLFTALCMLLWTSSRLM